MRLRHGYPFLGLRRVGSYEDQRTSGVAFAVAIAFLGCLLASCTRHPSVAFIDNDVGKVVLHASSGGATFWLFRNHNDAAGNVCYGLSTGVAPPIQEIDTGGACLDSSFDTMEADPLTAQSSQGRQMAVGGPLSPNVFRVEVIVAGISHDAVIRHGFYMAATAYGGFVVKAFDSRGKLLRELKRTAPPTGPPPAPTLTPPGPPPSS